MGIKRQLAKRKAKRAFREKQLAKKQLAAQAANGSTASASWGLLGPGESDPTRPASGSSPVKASYRGAADEPITDCQEALVCSFDATTVDLDNPGVLLLQISADLMLRSDALMTRAGFQHLHRMAEARGDCWAQVRFFGQLTQAIEMGPQHLASWSGVAHSLQVRLHGSTARVLRFVPVPSNLEGSDWSKWFQQQWRAAGGKLSAATLEITTGPGWAGDWEPTFRPPEPAKPAAVPAGKRRAVVRRDPMGAVISMDIYEN